MESVPDMLRPMHFVFLFAAFAFLAFAAAEKEETKPLYVQREIEPQSEIEPQPDTNDLEADASYWGYGRPWRYGGWGGWRGGYGGWGGRGYGYGGGGRGWGGGGRGWGGGWGY
ncbi:hypothetical protein CAJAP_00458 [Camponotus japonicus]